MTQDIWISYELMVVGEPYIAYNDKENQPFQGKYFKRDDGSVYVEYSDGKSVDADEYLNDLIFLPSPKPKPKSKFDGHLDVNSFGVIVFKFDKSSKITDKSNSIQVGTLLNISDDIFQLMIDYRNQNKK